MGDPAKPRHRGAVDQNKAVAALSSIDPYQASNAPRTADLMFFDFGWYPVP
jgi:hypothetical protein